MFAYTGRGGGVECERCVLTWGGGGGDGVEEFAAVGNEGFQSGVQGFDGVEDVAFSATSAVFSLFSFSDAIRTVRASISPFNFSSCLSILLRVGGGGGWCDEDDNKFRFFKIFLELDLIPHQKPKTDSIRLAHLSVRYE